MRSWLRLVKHHRVRARCEVNGVNMGLSASAMDRRAEPYANSKQDASRRKPLMLIVSVAVTSVVMGMVIVAAAALLQYKPAQRHVEFEITKPSWDR